MGGNRVSIRIRDGHPSLVLDQNQSGRTQGLKYAAISWTLMWELMAATGWTPGPLVSSPRVLVTLLPGDAHSTDTGARVGLALQLNPAFTDWMMGWPSGWTDPLQPATAWSRWLQHARGAC